jgi:hypothetical protein
MLRLSRLTRLTVSSKSKATSVNLILARQNYLLSCIETTDAENTFDTDELEHFSDIKKSEVKIAGKISTSAYLSMRPKEHAHIALVHAVPVLNKLYKTDDILINMAPLDDGITKIIDKFYGIRVSTCTNYKLVDWSKLASRENAAYLKKMVKKR